MTTQEAVKAEDVKAALDAAKDCLADLCLGRRRWMMSVPAREDDPDLLIGRALTLASRFVEQHEE